VAVVFDEAQLPEFVHEDTHARARRADDFSQRLLADWRCDRLRPAVLAEIRQQKKRARQPLFAGVEKLVHQIFLDPAVARQKMRHEQLGESRLSVKDAHHLGLAHSDDLAFGHGLGCCKA